MLNKARKNNFLDSGTASFGNWTFTTEIKPPKGVHISQQECHWGWVGHTTFAVTKDVTAGHCSLSCRVHSVTHCGNPKTFVIFSTPAYPFLDKLGQFNFLPVTFADKYSYIC